METEVEEYNSADEFEDQPPNVTRGVNNKRNGASTSNNSQAIIVVSTRRDDGDATINEGEISAPTGHQTKSIVKEKKNTRGKLPTYTHLETRSSPSTFVETMQQLKTKELNEAQLQTLHTIGFGNLLSLKLKKQPLSLGAWLVDHFDPNKCSIEFPGGRSIEISDIDVHRCLGIPLDNEVVEIKGQNENKDVIDKWRAQFDKQYASLRPSHVKKAMLSCNDGGLEFVQNFLVLFDTTMVNSQQSGGVYQGLVRSISSVDSVKNKNWCQYVINGLIRGKLKFGPNKKGSFGGPLLFLVLLYIDRVVHQGQRQVLRALPSFTGWDDTTVSAREKSEMISGGFGKGRIEPPMEFKDSIPMALQLEMTEMPLVTKEDYLNDIIKAVVDMSVAMKTFVGKLNEIPNVLRTDAPMISMYELSKTILGRGIPTSLEASSKVGSQVEEVLTQGTNCTYLDASLLLNMKKIEEAINLRDALLAEKNGCPNFNLGVEGVDRPIRDPVEEVIADIVRQERNNGGGLIDEHTDIGESGERHVVQVNIDKENDEDRVNYGSSNNLNEDETVDTTDFDNSGLNFMDTRLSLDKGKGHNVPTSMLAWNIADKVVYKEKSIDMDDIGNFKTPRPRRSVKPSVVDTSPYVSRFNDPENRNNKEQSMVVNVVKALKNKKILFEYENNSVITAGKFILRTEECQSLLNNFVASSVMDVWAMRLNHEEKRRSNLSPYIYFVPTFVTIPAVCNTWEKTFDKRFTHFSLQFYEGASDEELQIDKLDMTMFPVLDKGHYYVICFKMKTGVA